MVLQAKTQQATLERCARIETLGDFGCDGRPWRVTEGGTAEAKNKMLLGAGERFLTAAKANGKNGLWLIENHNMTLEDTALMDKRLPEVLAAGADHLIYYYYPRNLPDPERQMGVLAAHLKAREAARCR